jgi:hypothetical protein
MNAVISFNNYDKFYYPFIFLFILIQMIIRR